MTRVADGRLNAGTARQQAHELTIVGATLFDSHLCVQYSVTPVPDALASLEDVSEGDAGVAVDEAWRVYDCRTAYRRSRDGSRIVGAVRIGPHVGMTAGLVRVLFPPLARASALEKVLCELHLDVQPRGVRATSIRWSRRRLHES